MKAAAVHLQQVNEQTLDHQTAIHSLGVVMYQLLTGQLPFQARNSYDLIYPIVNAGPRRPSARRSDIPPSLDAIVARAMSKKLESRYTSWAEFSHDLAQVFRSNGCTVPAGQLADYQPTVSGRTKVRHRPGP